MYYCSDKNTFTLCSKYVISLQAEGMCHMTILDHLCMSLTVFICLHLVTAEFMLCVDEMSLNYNYYHGFQRRTFLY